MTKQQQQQQQQLMQIAQELLDNHHPVLLQLAADSRAFSDLLWKAKRVLAEIKRGE